MARRNGGRALITTRHRLRGRAGIRRSAATVGNIVRYIDANSVQRRRAIVAALIAFWTVIVGAEWALPGVNAAPAHGPHTLAASAVGAPLSVELDHPHVSQPDAECTPDTLAEAILPRGTVSLIALALGLVVAVLPLLWCQAAKAPVRGPPRNARALRTGRDVLAHLCIARR